MQYPDRFSSTSSDDGREWIALSALDIYGIECGVFYYMLPIETVAYRGSNDG